MSASAATVPRAVLARGVDVALRDGATVRVRAVAPSDAPALAVFLGELSERDRYLRFFSGGIALDLTARDLAKQDAGLGLVALAGDPERIVGHATYVPEPDIPQQAEIAFAITPRFQQHGLATTLLVELAEAAVAAGIEEFTALVLPANHRMIDVFRHSGFAVEVRPQDGLLHVTLPTVPTPEGARRFAQREREAAIAAVGHVLRPASIAVIGASRRPGTIGHEVLGNILAGGYAGPLAAVNPNAEQVSGVPCFATIEDVPFDVELAVVAVPSPFVLDAARGCAAKGVRALVVLTAGFSETGTAGRTRERELLAICRASGMRMVGPNCLGVVNTDPAVSLDATFSPGSPPPGRVAFASQSGAFGIAAIELARARGLGISSFVSMGDKADMSGNDFLQFWEGDERTDIVMLYLESFGNPRRFGRIARRLSAAKPVIAVKSGRTVAGSRAAASHTGALLAAGDASVDALFHHAGVIRAAGVDEMFDVAAVLASGRSMTGDRVAIVTNVGGPGILAADACVGEGLRVEPLAGATVEALRRQLPAEAGVENPVDLIASAGADDFSHALGVVLDDPEVDAVVTIFVQPLATQAEDVYEAIRAAASTKPVVAVFLGHDVPQGAVEVPVFTTVERAARALGLVARDAARRRAEDDAPPPEGVDADRATAVIAEYLEHGDGWLPPAAVEALLEAYGVSRPASEVSPSPHAAGRAAARLGGPLAVKAIARGLLHKTDAGAVALGLSGPAAVASAARRMRADVEQLGVPVEGFLVQRMIAPGPELIVGVVNDPAFGPLVAVGAGGTAAELIGDVQVRLAPVGPAAAERMLRDLRTFPLLDGFRGAPRCDLDAVCDVIGRVSALAATHPEVAELDCNPVIAGPDGAVVVDARIRLVRPPQPRPYMALDR